VDDIEVVRRGFAALREGGVEALLPFISADFEVTTPASLAAEPDTYRGHDGLRRYFASFYEAMDEVTFEPHEFVTAGGRVVVPFTLRARGRSTGLAFEQEAVFVWRIREGLATGLSVHPGRDAAIAEAEG
jgi:ketosteroid isomerase-like protein